MVRLVQDALVANGIEDKVLAVGQFNPRGHSGGMFAGGLAGSEAGGMIGGAADSIGMGVGSLQGCGPRARLVWTARQDARWCFRYRGVRIRCIHPTGTADVTNVSGRAFCP